MSGKDHALELIKRTKTIQDKSREQCKKHYKDSEDLLKNLEELESAIKERTFNVGRPIHNFVGRKAELEKIENVMESVGRGVALAQASAISGLGGIGKTQLAKRVAYEYFNTKDHNAIWIDAETATGLTNSFHKIAEMMGISIYQSNNNHPDNVRPLKNIVFDVYDSLSQRKTLIIFDNVTKYDEVRQFMPWRYFPNRRCFHVLITSRNSSWDVGKRESIIVIQLQKFTKDEAVQYVKRVLQITSEEESIEDDIDKLINEMDYFPLGLSQAVAYIKYARLKERDYEIKNYVDMYKRSKAALYELPTHHYDPYKRTICTTWQITFDAIESEESLGRKALELIYTMAFIAPNDILVEEFFLREGDDTNYFWDALDLLDQYSITTTVDAVTSVHRLVRDVIQLWLQQREETQIYLAKILEVQYLWNFNNLYYKKVAAAHVVMFLQEACQFQAITIDLFGKEKNLSFLILQYVAESDLKAVVEKLLEHLEIGSSLLFPEYKTQILRMAVRSGSKSILDHIWPGDLKLQFEMRVLAAWNKGEYQQLRSFLLEIGENCNCLINTEMDDMDTFAVIDIVDFFADEIRLRTEGVTALFFACSGGDLELAKILVEFGANVNCMLKPMETALHRACENGHLAVVKFLVEKGANMDIARFKFDTPLYQAARQDKKEMVSFLLETAANRKCLATIGRENAFCAAIMKKYLGIARLILESGIDVNYSDILGRTPLHHAVSTGNLKLVELV